MKLKTGDQVVIIAGKDKGKTGKIVRTLVEVNKVVVEGVNIRTRHVKKTASKAGERIQYEAPLQASNVMIIDPETKKRSRIGYKKLENGKKQRFYKKSKSEIKDATVKVKTKES